MFYRVDTFNQRARTTMFDGDGFHHRHAELAREQVRVDANAAPFRRVDHIEREQHRPPKALQFEHET